MKDTNSSMQKFYEEKLMQIAPEQRLRMGCSMFDAAKQLVISSIVAENPQISNQEIKRKIFLRFYGLELTKQQCEKILREI